MLGALAIVGGGIALAGERDRPDHLRLAGLLFAVGATVCFAVRDNLVRALHAHASPETAAAATLIAGTIVATAWARRAPSRARAARRSRRPASCSGSPTSASSRRTSTGR